MRELTFTAAHGPAGAQLPAVFARPSRLIDWGFALAIASLFSGLNQKIGPAKVQLADLMFILMIGVVVIRDFATPRVSRSVLTALGAFFLVYLISALTVDLKMFVKESVQIGLAMGFLTAAFGYYRTRPTDRLLVLTSVLLAVVTAVNIGWHLANGYTVGWKMLNEPKGVFILLPLVLMLNAARFGQGSRAWPFLLLAAVCAVLIVMSGERKAYLFAALAPLFWGGGPAVWRYAAVGIAMLPLVTLVDGFDRSSYLGRQVGSVADAISGRDSGVEAADLRTLLDDRRPSTLSNVQREISNRVAASLWERSRTFGIGTGAFIRTIERDTTLPPEFRMNVHGEFLRALYENGIVGLMAYVALWAAALAGILRRWKATAASGDARLNGIKLAALTMFLIYCSFEASKGLTLLCICALPFLVALRPRTAQAHAVTAQRSGKMETW